VVPILRPFADRIQAYSPHVPDSVFTSLGVKRVTSLEALFATSDVLVELAPATPANLHIVNEALLRRLPEGAVFVNAGRGCVVDEEALLREARTGRLQIALDVYEKEPLPGRIAVQGASQRDAHAPLGRSDPRSTARLRNPGLEEPPGLSPGPAPGGISDFGGL